MSLATRSLLVALFLLVTRTGAQTLVYEKVGGSDVPTLGSDVVGLDDIDGDGIPDFAAVGRAPATGDDTLVTVKAYSGRDGAQVFVHSFVTQATMVAPHLRLVNAGDVSGDGTPDVALGILWSAGAPLQPGKVLLLSGVDGARVATFSGPFGVSSFDAGKDVDGDGTPDLVILSSSSNAVVFVAVSGASGLAIGPPTGLATAPSVLVGAMFAASIRFAGDHDGDGVPEVLVGMPGARAVQLYTAAGTHLRTFKPCVPRVSCCINGCYSGPIFTDFGRGFVEIGDVDGDLLPEVVVARSFDDCYPTTSNPKIFGFPSATGGCLFQVNAPVAISDGQNLARVADVDGDGIDDFAVANGPLTGVVRVLSGADGSEVLGLPLPPSSSHVSFPLYDVYNTVDGVGDLNGDGAGEIIVGHPDGGLVRVYSGRPIEATVDVLGVGGGLAGFAPSLSMPLPLLGTQPALSLSGGPASMAGLLAVSSVPENPFPILPGLAIYPDFSDPATWTLIGFQTNGLGAWELPIPLPFDIRLAGIRAVLQAWFPSPAGLSGLSATNGLSLRIGL